MWRRWREGLAGGGVSEGGVDMGEKMSQKCIFCDTYIHVWCAYNFKQMHTKPSYIVHVHVYVHVYVQVCCTCIKDITLDMSLLNMLSGSMCLVIHTTTLHVWHSHDW